MKVKPLQDRVVIKRLEEEGKTVTGRGADTDTMVASARAYVSALNKLAIKRDRLHAQADANTVVSA